MESACASPDWVTKTKLKRPAGVGIFDGARGSGQLKKPRIVYNSKRHRDPFNLSAHDDKENENETEASDAKLAHADTIPVAQKKKRQNETGVTDAKIAPAKPIPVAQKEKKEKKENKTSTKWYQVEKIVRQRHSEAGNSESQYLVKWAGKQANGKPWPCSWEEESHISSAVLDDWKVEIQRRKDKPDECESGKPVKLGAQVIGECEYDPGKVLLRLFGGRERMVNWENVRFGDLMAWDEG
ncbi:hypothetical protein AC578_1460 [Pseudocercospora eumusae]|uniref:Chromo domain-containing protein n=1 Tax=Pseudocercospora eumusae TaxID=321146 RepID=A0A139H6R6_9PEZI|nr:hypothetical protein AC578_1460 [Pseudocercospora eumusae]